MPNPEIAPITLDELAAAQLPLVGWENDNHHAALVRNPDSPFYGRLLWVMRRETLDALDPVLSNIPAVLKGDATWGVRDDGSYGTLARGLPYPGFAVIGLIGWYLNDLTEEQRAGLPLRDAVANLENVTDGPDNPSGEPNWKPGPSGEVKYGAYGQRIPLPDASGTVLPVPAATTTGHPLAVDVPAATTTGPSTHMFHVVAAGDPDAALIAQARAAMAAVDRFAGDMYGVRSALARALGARLLGLEP